MAVVATATAPVAHNLGFVDSGRLWADSGITPKWTAIVPASGSRLKTTGKVLSPNSAKSSRNT